MSQLPPIDRSAIKVSNLQRQGQDAFVATSPADRIRMMWQLTIDAWMFKDPKIAESRLQRHVVRVDRRAG